MENIRITSGKYRGQSIKSPNSRLTHPMGAREKLALFNMISEYLPNSKVLDAYAGSGALGIEALSRGAGEVVFTEKSPKVANIIKQNLNGLELFDSAKIIVSDVKNFSSEDKFDVIIVDPPYDNFEVSDVAQLAKYVKNGGIFVLSHPGEAPEIEGLRLQKTHKYAGAYISIYNK